MLDSDSCTVLGPNRKNKAIQFHGTAPKITVWVNLAPLGHDQYFELPNFRNLSITRLCKVNIKPNHVHQCFRRNRLSVASGNKSKKRKLSAPPESAKLDSKPKKKPRKTLASGGCICGRVKFTMSRSLKPYAIYKCHCNTCRQLGSRNGGITWVGFESKFVTFTNWHVDLMRTHGKRRACPNCSCSIFMAYADDYVYIDERRLKDGAQYTKSSYLSNLHREYQCHKKGICVGHIYTKSDGLPPDYTFDPPDIPKFDEDANWIQG